MWHPGPPSSTPEQALSRADGLRIMADRRIAIVTGGNRGIGREIARQLMKEDVFVIIGARDDAKCAQVAEELAAHGPNIAAVPLDVNSMISAHRFVRHVLTHHGQPGILVNNAGIHPEAVDAKFSDTPISVWRDTFETNLFGAVRLCRVVVPVMHECGYGRVVNISSGLAQLHSARRSVGTRRVGTWPAMSASRALATSTSGVKVG